MPARKRINRQKDYVMSAVEEVPAAFKNRKKTVKNGAATNKRGWVLITEPLPSRGGKPESNSNVYDEVVSHFADSKRKSARVVMNGRTVKAMNQGLKASVKRLKFKHITVHGRKVENEDRVYLVKE